MRTPYTLNDMIERLRESKYPDDVDAFLDFLPQSNHDGTPFELARIGRVLDAVGKELISISIKDAASQLDLKCEDGNVVFRRKSDGMIDVEFLERNSI